MTILLFDTQRTAYNKPFLLFIALHLMIPYYGRLRQYEKVDIRSILVLYNSFPHDILSSIKADIVMRLGDDCLMPFNNVCFFITLYSDTFPTIPLPLTRSLLTPILTNILSKFLNIYHIFCIPKPPVSRETGGLFFFIFFP